MSERKASAYQAALIGDLVGSRKAADRVALHRAVTGVLSSTDSGAAIEVPAITAGDEFQGRYADVGAALGAAFRIRLALLPEVDVRFGVGWGEITVLDEERRIQDGPAWWSARAAIVATEDAATQPGLRTLRTSYQPSGDDGPPTEAVNAALICRDHLVGSLDDRSVRILRGLMAGQAKTTLAEAEGISPSAVSQRAVRDGLDAIVAASARLEQVR
ncbi:SatD family protein [Luteipulveratus flavus]|uniref:SatD family protein n=1 Tax=Luteipulveratus flavus TaxID=3031728 RepID=A0ABT6C940_9MICO|nr:SatD family protein [Luteipulveratus sp. YIM 133296]MDF8265315.1 SatD family protein [Luteipulveratus sp. YIM 133296]